MIRRLARDTASARTPHFASIAATMTGVRVRASALTRLVISIATLSIGGCLVYVHTNPRRFRIHPLPYVSDCGLYDPERIVLAIGLALSAALFTPISFGLRAQQQADAFRLSSKVAERRSAHGLTAALVLAFSLAAFAAVPGFFIAHHVGAAIFAVAAAVWSFSVASVGHALIHARAPGVKAARLPRWVAIVYVLACVQMVIIALFAVVWISALTGIPWKLTHRNKDPRFIVLAILEYIGTSAFLVVLHIVGVRRLANHDIVFGVALTQKKRVEPSTYISSPLRSHPV